MLIIIKHQQMNSIYVKQKQKYQIFYQISLGNERRIMNKERYEKYVEIT